MLLDTASLYFRAFYGVPDSVTAPDGTPVNAVRGLLDFISRLVSQHRPSHLACCWDNDWRPAWRVDLLPSYKAHRVLDGARADVEQVPDALQVQVPVIEAVLEAFGIAVVGADGYEADDVIGSLATQATMPVDIVTGDRDLFQLVDDARGIRVLYVARGVGRHEIVTDDWVRERYGVAPSQYADFATLRGDASDGLPGVAGVGEKTAATLLTHFGDMASLLAAVEDPRSELAGGPRRKLKDAADYLAVAPTVVRVARDLDLRSASRSLQLPRTPVDPDRLVELSQTWGLDSPTARLVDTLTTLHAHD
jgi:5'-3' exonuclease